MLTCPCWKNWDKSADNGFSNCLYPVSPRSPISIKCTSALVPASDMWLVYTFTRYVSTAPKIHSTDKAIIQSKLCLVAQPTMSSQLYCWAKFGRNQFSSFDCCANQMWVIVASPLSCLGPKLKDTETRFQALSFFAAAQSKPMVACDSQGMTSY